MLGVLAFSAIVIGMLAVDLLVVHRKAHEVPMKEALVWTVVWIAVALLFNAGVFLFKGTQSGLEFFTGYILEKALSVDNLFVFIVIFEYFAVPSAYQHRVLFYGVLGAVITRALFIFIGIELIKIFHFVIYIFAVFLIFTGIKLLKQKEEKVDPEKNWALKVFKRFFRVYPRYEGQKFFVRHEGKTLATPLMVVLVVLEGTDILFAVDSIPAIFAVTLDPFIVFTSNIFAILGLRALYFVVAGFLKRFRYLRLGLAFVLAFIGVKMILSDFYPIPVHYSLTVVALTLLLATVASIVKTKPEGSKR